MDPIAEKSSKTLANGGHVANDDIPKDGTGNVLLLARLLRFAACMPNMSIRRHQARSVAGALPGLAEAAVLQGTELDQENPGDRRRLR